MIKKYAKPIGISLFIVLLAIISLFVFRKAPEGVVIRFENPDVKMELGESFSVPSIYVYEEKSGKIVSKDVELISLKGQDGEEVKVAYGTIVPEKIGTYTAVFKSSAMALEQKVKIECVDSKAPIITFEAPTQYYIRERGKTTYQTFEVPQYTYSDYSGINEKESGLTITLNDKKVECKDNTFTLKEWGQLVFTVVAVDGVGNKNVYTSVASAYEPYEDPSLESGVLSDFDEEDYIRTLSYGYANRKFDVTFMQKYKDSMGVTEKGVLKVEANSESTCDIMFAAQVKRSDIDYIDLRVCLQNATLNSPAINPYNIAVGEPGKQFLMGRYTKAYLEENVWTTIRVSGDKYLDSLVENGIVKGFTLNLHSPQQGATVLYIDEIKYGKFYTDKTLQKGVLATFDNENYTKNIVEYYTKDSAVTTSANKIEYLQSYADKNGRKEDGVVKAEYYGAIGDITTQVILPQAVKRSSVNRIVVCLAQTGVRTCDEIVKQIMVTSPLAEDIWGTAFESFEIAENQWNYLCISNPLLLDALAGKDGYIRSINFTHFRKNDAEARTLYFAGMHSYWTDNVLEEYVLADFEEDAYAVHNASRGVAIWDETNRVSEKEVISSYTDGKKTAKKGVLHLQFNATKAEKKYFDFSITFGKAIKRTAIETLKITLAQTGIEAHSGLKTFFVTSACDGNDIWKDDGRYAIYELQENQWTTIEIPEKVLDAATDADGYIRALSFYSEKGVKSGKDAAHVYIDEVSYLGEPYKDKNLSANCLADFTENQYMSNARKGAAVGTTPASVEVLSNYVDKFGVKESGILKVVGTPNEKEQFDFSIYFGRKIAYKNVEALKIRIAQTNISSDGPLKTFFVTSNTKGNDIWKDDGRYAIYGVAEDKWVTITIPKSVLKAAQDKSGYISSLSFFCDNGIVKKAESPIIYISEIKYVANANTLYEDEQLEDFVLADFTEADYKYNAKKGAAVGTTPDSAKVISSYTDRNKVKETGVLKIIGEPNEKNQFDFSVHFGKKIAYKSVESLTIRVAQSNISSNGPLKTFFVTSNTKGNDIWTDDGRYTICEVSDNKWTTITIPKSVLKAAQDKNGYISSLSFYCDNGVVKKSKAPTIYVSEIKYVPDINMVYQDRNLEEDVLADFVETNYKYNARKGAAVGTNPKSMQVLSAYTDKQSVKESGVLKIVGEPNEKGQFDFSIYFGKKIAYKSVESLTLRVAQSNISSNGPLKTFFVTSNTKGNDIWTDDGRYAIYEVADNEWTTITIPKSVLKAAQDKKGYISSLSLYCDNGRIKSSEEAVIYVAEVSYMSTLFEDDSLEEYKLADFVEEEYRHNVRQGVAVGTMPETVKIVSSHTDKNGQKESAVLQIAGSTNEQGKFDFSVHFGQKIPYEKVESLSIRIAQRNIDSDGPLKTFFVTSNTKGNDIWTDDGRYAIYEVADNEWTTIIIPKSVLLHAQDESGNISSLSFFCDNGLKDETKNPVIYLAEITYTPAIYEDEELEECVLADFVEEDYKGNVRSGVAVGTTPASKKVLASYTDKKQAKETGVLNILCEPNATGKFDFAIHFGQKIIGSEVEAITIRIAQKNINSNGPLKTFFVTSNTKGNDIWTDDGRYEMHPHCNSYQGLYVIGADTVGVNLTAAIPETGTHDCGAYLTEAEFLAQVEDGSVNLSGWDNGFWKIRDGEVPMPIPLAPCVDTVLGDGVLADFTEATYKNNVGKGRAVGTVPTKAEVLTSYEDSLGTSANGVLKITPTPNANGKFDFSVRFGQKVKCADVESIVVRIAQQNVKDPGNALRTFFVTSNRSDIPIWDSSNYYDIFAVSENTWTTITLKKSVIESAADDDGYLSKLSFFCDNGRVDTGKPAAIYIDEIYYTSKDTNGNVKFGVLSDTHFADDNNGARETNLKKALQYYRENAVDAIIMNGDVSDMGTAKSYQNLVGVIKEVYPDDSARPTIISTADNHEYYDAWSWANRTGTYTASQETFLTNYANALGQTTMNTSLEINGYQFIGVSADTAQAYNANGVLCNGLAGYSDETKAWLENEIQKAAEKDATKPIFVAVHQPPYDTVTASIEHGNAGLTSIFEKYPQVVVFSSHTHSSIKQENSIDQDKYTVVNTGSLFYVGGDEMNYVNTGNAADYLLHAYNFGEGLLVSVSNNQVSIERRDFFWGGKIKTDWVFDTTNGKEGFVYTDARKENRVAPTFAADAQLSIAKYTTGYQWSSLIKATPEDSVLLTFPSATHDDFVQYYTVVVKDASDNVVTLKRLGTGNDATSSNYVSDFYWGIDKMAMTQEMVVKGLTPGETYTFEVRAVETFGKMGEPLIGTFTFE